MCTTLNSKVSISRTHYKWKHAHVFPIKKYIISVSDLYSSNHNEIQVKACSRSINKLSCIAVQVLSFLMIVNDSDIVDFISTSQQQSLDSRFHFMFDATQNNLSVSQVAKLLILR